MRALPWIALAFSMGTSGCFLDTEGTGGMGGDGGSETGGMGGTGGMSTGGTGGTAKGGTGGTTGSEDCTNGIDDNGDGLLDCADPQCQPHYTCVPIPEPGWSTVGYRAFRDFADPAIDCGALDPLGEDLFGGLWVPSSGCACTCGVPSGATCSLSATFWNQPTCIGKGLSVPGGCYDSLNNVRVAGVTTVVPTVEQPGSCVSGVSGAPQSPAWEDAVDMCMVPSIGGGCPSDWGCIARPIGPFDASPCIEQSGVAGCPASYPERHVYYGDFQDTRSCSTTGCSCSAADGETCDGSVVLYDDNACSSQPVAQYALDGTCHATGFSSGDVSSGRLASSVSGGSCSPNGSPSLVGGVAETNPRTVCCVSP